MNLCYIVSINEIYFLKNIFIFLKRINIFKLIQCYSTLNSPNSAAIVYDYQISGTTQDNSNIHGQISGSDGGNVQLQSGVRTGGLRGTPSDQQQNTKSDQQKRVRFQVDQDQSDYSSAAKRPKLDVPVQGLQPNLQSQFQSVQSTDSVVSQEQVTGIPHHAMQQQMQDLSKKQQVCSSAQMQQPVQCTITSQQVFAGVDIQPNVAGTGIPVTQLSHGQIQQEIQPVSTQHQVASSAAIQQQMPNVVSTSDNVVIADIQQKIQYCIQEYLKAGAIVDPSVLAAEVQQQMPVGINLDPNLLFQEVQKQMHLFAQQNQSVSSSVSQQNIISQDQSLLAGQVQQHMQSVVGQVGTGYDVDTSLGNVQNVSPQQQSQEFCRMVAFRSDGSRREFLIKEEDGHQVLSLCAQADVSDPSNYCAVNTSMMYPPQTSQTFPQHWTLSDLHTDTSSSLATRSVHSAASGGDPCQSIPSDTTRYLH